jgi:hypothetical protein
MLAHRPRHNVCDPQEQDPHQKPRARSVVRSVATAKVPRKCGRGSPSQRQLHRQRARRDRAKKHPVENVVLQDRNDSHGQERTRRQLCDQPQFSRQRSTCVRGKQFSIAFCLSAAAGVCTRSCILVLHASASHHTRHTPHTNTTTTTTTTTTSCYFRCVQLVAGGLNSVDATQNIRTSQLVGGKCARPIFLSPHSPAIDQDVTVPITHVRTRMHTYACTYARWSTEASTRGRNLWMGPRDGREERCATVCGEGIGMGGRKRPRLEGDDDDDAARGEVWRGHPFNAESNSRPDVLLS